MLIKRKYLCIFCGKRKDVSQSLYNNKRVGMCRECLSALSSAPRPPVFPASGDIDYVISPLFYVGKLRDVIIDLKFNGAYANAEVLSNLMCDLLSDMTHIAGFDCVIPVPLSKKRLRERGYNQAALMAKPFAEFFGVPFREDVLAKIRETKRQSLVDFSERFTNLSGAFSASHDAKGMRVLLFDDIFTTGSTLSECAAALKKAGAKSVAGVTAALRDRSV